MNQNGFSVVYALILTAMTLAVGTVVLKNVQTSRLATSKSMEENATTIFISSAAETFLIALDLAETRYLEHVYNCDNYSSFAEALMKGHGCPGVGQINLFESKDLSLLEKSESQYFDYKNLKWSLGQSKVNSPSDNFIIRIPIDDLYSVEFYLDATLPEKSWLLTKAILMKGNEELYNKKVSFSLSRQDYLVHVEGSDNTISQEIQNPRNPCLSGEWMTFLTGSPCLPLEQAGGVTGLGFYQNKYFGLRNYNGEIIDLNNPLSNNDNVVDETGKLNGKSVFPPYDKETLLGATDFEIIDEDSGAPQLYFLKGQGVSGAIRYLDTKNSSSFSVCNLGVMGWGQSFMGLGVSSGSAKLIPITGSPSVSVSNFTLKSESGEFLRAKVRSQKSPVTFNSSLPPEAVIYEASIGRYFICTVHKLSIVVLEYARTKGMTQSVEKFQRFTIL